MDTLDSTRSTDLAVPTSVYKYFDAHGVLIYVGVTSCGINRNRQHNSDKEWWQYVVRQEVEHLPDRPSALAREVELISENPTPFNRAHNPQHRQLRSAYLAMLEIGAFHNDPIRARRERNGKLLITGKIGDGYYVCRFYTRPEDALVAGALVYDETDARIPVYAGNLKVGRVGGIRSGRFVSSIEMFINRPVRGLISATTGTVSVSVASNKKPVTMKIRIVHLDDPQLAGLMRARKLEEQGLQFRG